MTTETIETHATHTVEDYVENGKLRPERVRVRAIRTKRPENSRKGLRYYDVEISVLDRPYTFAEDVTDVLRQAGFYIWISGRFTHEPFVIAADPDYKIARNFVPAEEL